MSPGSTAGKQYKPLTMDEAEDLINRAEWRSAKAALRSGKSIDDVAPHQYVVQKRGQRRDDFAEEEFWQMVELIKAEGRLERWTPPEGWEGRPQRNRYLYLGEYAYWFTMPYGAVPMLNREHVSVQERDGTRTVLDEGRPPTEVEDEMSETVWVLGPTKSRPERRLSFHLSPDCPGLRGFKPEAIERQEAEDREYKRCRANGPCNSAKKAGPRLGRNRQMVTGGKRQ